MLYILYPQRPRIKVGEGEERGEGERRGRGGGASHDESSPVPSSNPSLFLKVGRHGQRLKDTDDENQGLTWVFEALRSHSKVFTSITVVVMTTGILIDQ